MRRAEAVVEVERRLDLFVEPALHAWATERPTLLAAALVFYVWIHLPATIGALVWAWLERPAAFAAARNVFLVAQALTVVGYLLVPTAPPRLVAGLGFTDTLGGFWAAAPPGAAPTVQSPSARIPSGHVVFAPIPGGGVFALPRRPRVRGCGGRYPAPFVPGTFITANHFWLDAFVAAFVVLAAAGLVLGGPAALRRMGAATWTPAPLRFADETPTGAR